MFPILETERLTLKPLKENDFDDMYKIHSDEKTLSAAEGILYSDPAKFLKDMIILVNNQNIFTVRLKESNVFIGYIGCHQYIDKKKTEIKYSQTWTAFLPEHWGKGYCTETTKKLLHFAFTGVQTPWICANHFQTNPAAGKVLAKCGFKFYKTFKMNSQSYDQYRYTKEDYLKNDTETSKIVYNYVIPTNKSLYNYNNPIRIIDSITYIKEPTGYLCGQTVVAMLANVPIDEVIAIMETDKGTSVSEIDAALYYYGIKHGKSRKRVTADTILPEIFILSLKLPGYGHWSLYYKGTYYDPEFGVSKELPENAVLTHYWEIFQ